MKVERAVDPLTSNLQEAQQYERALEGEVFQLTNTFDEEYEMREGLQGQLLPCEFSISLVR